MTDRKDIPPDNGERPPFDNGEPALGEVGTEGKFGESYDSNSEREWRDRARRRDMPGEVRGSGVGAGGGSAGEDFSEDAGGSDTPPDAAD